jgi:XTP/dITP diphosphohydrolase
MKEIIFASKNPGKIKEVSELFKEINIKIISLNDLDGVPDIVEDGSTFEENAIKKARVIYDVLNIPVISDDSGIAVEQLNWLPGVYSARFAGENASDDDNNKMLLESLTGFPEPHKAKYVCFAVFYDGNEYIVESGEINGRITSIARGHNGFGYDPYFIPDEYKFTMAELSPEEKNRISHRAIAFNKLKMKMKERQ